MSEQKVMIVQVPSEANAERLICTRISDENAEGWRVVQMMDHNGFLVMLLERAADDESWEILDRPEAVGLTAALDALIAHPDDLIAVLVEAGVLVEVGEFVESDDESPLPLFAAAPKRTRDE